ncbi:MAG: CBS domain-containing protein [Candidatus Omnitrophica bacterium]|nr:CBS domain-containing protein [Candidatus Omnitrophota bacterium]
MSVIDMERALELCLGHEKLVASLCKMLVEQNEADFKALKRSFLENDLENVARSAHRMKGASANCAAVNLENLTKEIVRDDYVGNEGMLDLSNVSEQEEMNKEETSQVSEGIVRLKSDTADKEQKPVSDILFEVQKATAKESEKEKTDEVWMDISFGQKHVSDFMIKDVEVVSEDDTLSTVLTKMKKNNIGAVIVSKNDKPIGIFTERDFLVKTAEFAPKVDLDKLKASDYMTTGMTVCFPWHTIIHAMKIMQGNHIRHIPVVDNDKLKGILSLRDIMDFSLHELSLHIKEKAAAYEELESTNEVLKRFQIQIARAAKMSAMGEMGSGIVHEINQPLMAISSYLEVILLSPVVQGDEKLKDKLNKIKQHFTRLSSVVKRMGDYSKVRQEQYRKDKISVPAKEAVHLFTQQFKDHNIELELNIDENIPEVSIDEHQVQDIIINFMVNARDAVNEAFNQKEGGKVTVFTKFLKEDGVVAVGVKDNGIPILKGTEDKLFNSFFTTKGPEKGTGLGLAVSSDIAAKHKGWISFVSNEGENKIFYFALPPFGEKALDNNKKFVHQISDKLKKTI